MQAVSVGPAHLLLLIWPRMHVRAQLESLERSGMGVEVVLGVGTAEVEVVGVPLLVGEGVAEVPPPEQRWLDRARAAWMSAEVHLDMRHCAATPWKAEVHRQAVSVSPLQP
jgi:hypothetical protein